jgi:hypothetical protein
VIDPNLLQACRLLFGKEVVISEEFFDYLQPSGLKSAFRRRVLETHPDTQQAFGEGGNEDFHTIQQAFATVTTYLQQRKNLNQLPAPPIPSPIASNMSVLYPALKSIGPIILEFPHRHSSSRASIDRFHQGALPQRPLLFGHFLYYSGLTTWRTITSILVQQQRERPRIGELGTRLGMLLPEDINRILGARNPRHLFGEAAVSLGLLTMQQMEILLWKQRRQQKKFGTILVEKNMITLRELTLLLALFRRHNRAYQKP